jgi:hypothetical protein
MLRANRCFIKSLVPRERILREFGEPALAFFNDMTTDPKLNPRPKADEIALGFRSDFESIWNRVPLFRRRKSSRFSRCRAGAKTGRHRGRAGTTQRFLRLSFLSGCSITTSRARRRPTILRSGCLR